MIRDIQDPEYPNTLEELAVVVRDQIIIDGMKVLVEFTPTVPHCSMATVIGLCIRVQLMQHLRSVDCEKQNVREKRYYHLQVRVKEGRHSAEDTINKQLNDKERVSAAMENPHLMGIVKQCISTCAYKLPDLQREGCCKGENADDSCCNNGQSSTCCSS